MKQKKVLLIITGSIAAYKALELLSLLKRNNYVITVILTNSALEFVTSLSFSSLGATVIKNDLFEIEQDMNMGHIELSRKNDLIITYPATANFIAKLASGKADDLASAIILASNKKIFIAPAMNVEMFNNNITQENLAKLEDNNIEIIYPDKGKLACGEEGEGKARQPAEVMAIINNNLSYHNKLSGKNILVTAGGTIEKIDPVRYLSNFSSGKQGIAIARKCQEYGANVTLIYSNITQRIPNNINPISVQSAREMQDSIIREIENKSYDCLFMAAAICDYSTNYIDQKIKKDEKDNVTLKLSKNPDIVNNICVHRSKPEIVVAFAAETENTIANAEKKLNSKGCDYIVANNVKNNQIFGSDNNNITLIDKNKILGTYQGSKDNAAIFLIKEIFK